MKRSTDRILTTHTGSLPRTAKVVELLLAEQKERGKHKTELNAAVREAINSGAEAGRMRHRRHQRRRTGRTDYTVHVLDRLSGYEGESSPPLGTGEPEFPSWPKSSSSSPRRSSTGDVHQRCRLERLAAALADIELTKGAMAGANVEKLAEEFS